MAISFTQVELTPVPLKLTHSRGDLAPANKKAASIAITMSGLIMAIPVARILSGLTDHFATWRIAYGGWSGLQALATLLVYFTLPDFPAKEGIDRSYLETMKGLLQMLVTEPMVALYSCAAAIIRLSRLIFELPGSDLA
jgi:predicted MFS family arabinose efflux permease